MPCCLAARLSLSTPQVLICKNVSAQNGMAAKTLQSPVDRRSSPALPFPFAPIPATCFQCHDHNSVHCVILSISGYDKRRMSRRFAEMLCWQKQACRPCCSICISCCCLSSMSLHQTAARGRDPQGGPQGTASSFWGWRKKTWTHCLLYWKHLLLLIPLLRYSSSGYKVAPRMCCTMHSCKDRRFLCAYMTIRSRST